MNPNNRRYAWDNEEEWRAVAPPIRKTGLLAGLPEGRGFGGRNVLEQSPGVVETVIEVPHGLPRLEPGSHQNTRNITQT